LAADERRRILALFLVWPVSVAFWIAQTQVWNVYNLWVRDHVDLAVAGFTVPVPWMQAIDGLAPVLMLPLVLWLWRGQAERGREPDDLAKMAIGCALFALGTLWLAAAPLVSGADDRAPLAWPIGFHLISNLGWLYFTPIAVALYAGRAPESLRGTMIGVNTTSIFAASLVSGRIGGLYEQLLPAQFWIIHAAIVGSGGILLALFARSIRCLMGNEPEAARS
jgi:proton-dependent oligopeptide transporter, POT family